MQRRGWLGASSGQARLATVAAGQVVVDDAHGLLVATVQLFAIGFYRLENSEFAEWKVRILPNGKFGLSHVNKYVPPSEPLVEAILRGSVANRPDSIRKEPPALPAVPHSRGRDDWIQTSGLTVPNRAISIELL